MVSSNFLNTFIDSILGDIIKKTSQEVADCLNQVLDNTAKLNGQTRHLLQGKLAEQTPKWKKRITDGDKKFRSPSQKGQTWRQRNKAKQVWFYLVILS